MDCKKAENLISAYINKTMSLEELRAFIAHVKSCSSCYDELQTYYMVYFAMEHLENGESNSSYNMNTVLLEDIRHRERYIKQERLKQGAWVLLAVLLLALTLLFLL